MEKDHHSIKLWISFTGFEIENSQVDVTDIGEIYANKNERNICFSFFKFMSQDGDVLGSEVWEALQDLGYIK